MYEWTYINLSHREASTHPPRLTTSLNSRAQKSSSGIRFSIHMCACIKTNVSAESPDNPAATIPPTSNAPQELLLYKMMSKCPLLDPSLPAKVEKPLTVELRGVLKSNKASHSRRVWCFDEFSSVSWGSSPKVIRMCAPGCNSQILSAFCRIIVAVG